MGVACCRMDRCLAIQKKMGLHPADPIVQEDGLNSMYKLLTNKFDGSYWNQRFGENKGIDMLYRLLYQHRGKELVERGVCRVIRVAATNLANAELIRTSRIESQIDALMEMEFDDDYIQEDGKAFQKNLYESYKTSGYKLIEISELEEAPQKCVQAMITYGRIVEVQTRGMATLASHTTDMRYRDAMIESGGADALAQVLELHREQLVTVRQALDVIYALARDDVKVRAQLGNNDVIHYIVLLYRHHLEDKDGVMVQKLLYALDWLVFENDRNLTRWNNRRGKVLLDRTVSNISSRLYENIVHIPYRFKKACEGMPEPEADFNELMPSNKGLLEHLDDEERILMEMDLLGRKAYPKPQSRLEKYKLQLIEEARAESKEKRMKEMKRYIAEKRRVELKKAQAEEAAKMQASGELAAQAKPKRGAVL